MDSEEEESARSKNEENAELLRLHAKAQEALGKGKHQIRMISKQRTEVHLIDQEPSEVLKMLARP